MNFFLKLKSYLFDRRILLRKLALLCLLAAFSTVSFAQQVVKGTVTSADTSVSSVTISVKGSNVATLTDNNGNFSINAGPTAVLVFSSVGYIAQDGACEGASYVVQKSGWLNQAYFFLITRDELNKNSMIVQNPAYN